MTGAEDVHAEGAQAIPGLSGIGRARDEQPKRCEPSWV
jgi:hypothetical protein